MANSARTGDLWWKNAIFYCLDVETFLDRDGDGYGDLTGLTERVDYLAGIGVSCLWLMPFHESPNRDDGYDVVDYYSVDHRLGSLGDFVTFVRTAKDRGMRVLIDLVVNHTSDRHPWFRDARRSRGSRFRDYYVWRDDPPDQPDATLVFPDAEDSIWTFDDEAGQWYLHHFYSHQPDLNLANPAVREEIAMIAGFWLELGVDGFRVDAVPFLFEKEPIAGDVELDPHALLRELRSFVTRRRGHSILLGEVNLPPGDAVRYFGEHPGDEMQVLFNFPVMQAMYLSLARRDAQPLAAALAGLPEVPEECQWANFVRNHDELTLDQLTEEEREEVFAAFGPREDMQVYGRGLRRRLPPMVDGDQQRMRMVYSLLFSLPGTPVLFYGEEIGMGENLSIEGRASVRTPMQWSDDANGGFSTAPASELRRPVTRGAFGPKRVSVAHQRRDPDSLLNWMEQAIRRRRETPELGWGTLTLLETGDTAVLAHACEWDSSRVVAVHNLSPEARTVRIDLQVAAEVTRLVDDLLPDGEPPPTVEDGALELKLGGYGYRWFRLSRGERRPAP